ncbi:DUF1294 domain-containing protein [Anaerotignum faecicola]|nr:DUF1294 domain-containing protein [Anaerotignum faecicola]
MSLGTKIVLCYYLIVNAVLFAAMWLDKTRAKKEAWRISESTLFVIALLGGGIGGFLAMYLFHHKNRKLHFYLIYGISVFLHAAVLYFIFAKLI